MKDIILDVSSYSGLLEWSVFLIVITLFIILLRRYIQKRKRLITLERELAQVRAEAGEKAREVTEVKLEFLANMSREIRTPVNGVIGMTNLLLDSNLSAEQQSYAVSVAKSADNLLDLLNDILDFSKIEAGGMSLEIIPFDLQKLMEEVSGFLTSKALKKDVEMILRYAPGTPRYVLGDPDRIQQIILNLANNALKYTRSGHVLINVETENTPDNEEITFQVSVEDTGVGMSPGKKEIIFDKFTGSDGLQDPASGKRHFGGTVLGLALSREFVEMMGGEIRVESTPGVGTVFTFQMNLQPDMSKERPSMINYDSDLSGVRVLVVDDNGVACRITEEQLVAVNMTVKRANSGPEALDMLLLAVRQNQPFDVAVIDYLMAGMNGIELACAIRDNEKIRDTSMMLISTTPIQGDVDQVERAGFEGFLLKPVAGEEIIHMLSALWSAKQGNIPLPLVTRQKLQQENSRRNHVQKEQYNFDGVQILLVEDNSVNQMLARRVLNKYGFLVTSAGNGREAVELVQQREFDLILMDCLMPIMDGYEATGLIIDYQKENACKHTPIIAFTANAMKGDEERCLAAGMDDYISKPLQLEKMIEVMSRWLTTILAERAGKDRIREAERKACLIERGVLDVLKSMTGDSFIPVLKSYISMAENTFPAMSDAIRKKDAVTLRREAHSLKSSSMQVGAMQVGDMAGEIEKMSLEAKFDEINMAIPPIAEMSAQVISQLTELIALEIQ